MVIENLKATISGMEIVIDHFEGTAEEIDGFFKGANSVIVSLSPVYREMKDLNDHFKKLENDRNKEVAIPNFMVSDPKFPEA